MISHEHPRFSNVELSPWRGGFGSASDIEPCYGCGNDTHLEERLNGNVETVYCSACRETCAICGDWIAGKAEMQDAKGRRIHIACEVAAIAEVFTEVIP
jgi:hypothetical protein